MKLHASKTEPSPENLQSVRATVHLAKEVGEGLGGCALLLEALP
jgi:hypothetical protein